MEPRPNARRYVDDLIAAFSRELGGAIGPGTTVVPFASRAGSATAVAYLLPEHTLVACAVDLAPKVASLDGVEVLGEQTFVASLASGGGRWLGGGVNRVLDGPLVAPHGDTTGLTSRWLHRDEPDDLALLTRFVEDVPDDDLDEAELSLDELDPAIHVFVDAAAGEIAAYASGRPFQFGPDFDDIGVVVHPSYRRRGLGAQVVHDYAAARRSTAPQLYRHDLANEASSRLSASLGFAEVHRVVGVTFD